MTTLVADHPTVGTNQRGALYLLISGKLLSSVAYFAALPYLTLYLVTVAGLPKAAAGALAGTVALVSSLGGLVAGVVIDRFGAVRLMKAGLVVYIASYLGLAFLRGLVAIVGMLLLMGLARMVLEPSSKRLMSTASAGADGGIFRKRYIVVALGAILGPPVGAGLYHLGLTPFFLFPAGVLTAYLLVLIAGGGRCAEYDVRGERPDRPLAGTRALLTDRTLLAITFTGLFFFMVFGQFDSTLPLLLHQFEGAEGVAIYAAALAGDAVIAIGIQAPLIRLSRRFSTTSMITVGCLSMVAAFGFFTATRWSLWFLVAGVACFALGEAILLPIPDVYLHQSAPEARKAAYFGFGELRYLGFLIGPTLGGAVLGLGSSAFGLTFAVGAALCLPLFRRTDRRVTGASLASATDSDKEISK